MNHNTLNHRLFPLMFLSELPAHKVKSLCSLSIPMSPAKGIHFTQWHARNGAKMESQAESNNSCLCNRWMEPVK